VASNEDNYRILRSLAIEAYARVEEALCGLFSDLLGTTFDLGGIVFYGISSGYARNRMIQTLLTKRDGDRWDRYWFGQDGMMKLVRRLDQERSWIVHWHPVDIRAKDRSETTLRKPNFWATGSQEEITEEDLQAFIDLANFVSRSINMFFITRKGELVGDQQLKEWFHLFQEPCVYPPPNDHPLSPNAQSQGVGRV
jgi:hypothetical protein